MPSSTIPDYLRRLLRAVRLASQLALVLAAGASLGLPAVAQDDLPAEMPNAALPDDCAKEGPAFRTSQYVCAGADLLPADWFIATEGVPLAETPAPNKATAGATGLAEEEVPAPPRTLGGGKRPNTGTSYIADRKYLWAHKVNGAELNNRGVLQIPVCWINSTADPDEREARRIVQDAIEATWHQALAVEFTDWTKCWAERIGGVRILIEDSGPQAFVGRRAGAEPVACG